MSVINSTTLRSVWIASTDTGGSGLAGYLVERAPTVAGPWTQVTPLPITAATFDHTGLAGGTTYFARVRAIDNAGNASPYSAIVSARTQAPTGGVITPAIVASRISGPAPLAVHFDATGTTSTNVLDPFRQLVYTFNYDDPASGTWAHGNPSYNSKNSDVGGPLGAHVFETPGTYVVTVTVSDGVGSSSTTVTITVNNPDTFFAGANTICVNDTGTNDGLGPSGCLYASAAPTGAAAVGKRILFRRGQTTVRDTGSMVSNQWTHYGAYGTGSKPIIQARSFSTDSVAGTVFRDVRFNAGIQIYSSEFLFLRCDFFNQTTPETTFLNGIQADYRETSCFFIDCDFNSFGSTSALWCVYGYMCRFVFRGCSETDIHTHAIRLPSTYKSIISNNRIRRNAGLSFTHCLKIHSNSLDQFIEGVSSVNARYSTRYLVIAANELASSTSNIDWTIGVCPQNSESPTEGVEDVLIENNLFWRTTSPVPSDIARSGRRITCIGNARIGPGEPVFIRGGHTAPPGWDGPYFTSRA